MRFKGIHLSKLGQKSSQNQVDYTCKNVSFFWWGYSVGERACCF